MERTDSNPYSIWQSILSASYDEFDGYISLLPTSFLLILNTWKWDKVEGFQNLWGNISRNDI